MLLLEGCDPLSRLGWYPRTPPPIDPTETFRVLGRHPHAPGRAAGSLRGPDEELGSGSSRTIKEGHTSAGAQGLVSPTVILPWVPRPSPRARPTAQPAREGSPGRQLGPRQHDCGFLAGSSTTSCISSLHHQPYSAPSQSLVPAPAPPLVRSEGRDPTAPSWTERGGRGPSERFRHRPHLPEPDGRSPCASKLSGLGSSRTVGRSGTDRLADRPCFPEEPLPEAVRPQPTVREL